MCRGGGGLWRGLWCEGSISLESKGIVSEKDEPGRWVSGVSKAPRRVLTSVSLVATICSSAGRGMLVALIGSRTTQAGDEVSRQVDVRSFEGRQLEER